MDEKLAEKLDEDEINLDRILEIKIELVQDLIGEIEYLSSPEFYESSIKHRMNALSNVRKSVRRTEKSERILNEMVIKFFDHYYHNATESLNYI